MEGYPNAPAQQQQPQQNPLPNSTGNKRSLAFLKVGLFELIFVVVVLLLLFGILNYFNILSVSTVFPNQFGWLPHQTNKQISKLTNKQNVAPSPANFTPAVFQYDIPKAKTLLVQYLKDNIKSDLFPATIEIKQNLPINNITSDSKGEFGSNFTVNQSSISVFLHFKENINIPNDYGIFIQPENIVQATSTASLANSLLTSYFKNPYTIANCQTKGTASYCENFQILTEGKRGYGIAFGQQGSKFIRIIFTCFIPKDSKIYPIQQSCIDARS